MDLRVLVALPFAAQIHNLKKIIQNTCFTSLYLIILHIISILTQTSNNNKKDKESYIKESNLCRGISEDLYPQIKEPTLLHI